MQLEIDQLAIERGERVVVEGLSFTARSGEAMLVRGANGAGKTTLLRAIAGLISPAAGRITLEGGAPGREVGEQCHMIDYRSAAKGLLSASENLAFWARYLGSTEGRVGPALAALELDHAADLPARELSLGQRRRLGLARLLIAERPLWLLDEPTSALDARAAELVGGIIQRHLAGGGIAVIATHLDIALRGALELVIPTLSRGWTEDV